MSVLSIAQDILIVIKAIHVITQEIKGNKNKAIRLANRVNSIVPTLKMITDDPTKALCSPDRLGDLLSYISGIKAFLEKFTSSNYFMKAFKISSDNKAFMELNEGFSTRVQALEFNIQVNAEKQRQEDQQDNESDQAEIKSLVEQILTSQGVMKDEITQQLSSMAYQAQNMFESTTDKIMQSNAEVMNYLANLKLGNMSNVPNLRTITHDQLSYEENEASHIGEGGFGAIYRGSYMGAPVAIKLIKYAKITREMKEELKKEALTMQMLTFPGIIHFYGAQLETSPRFIVMELAMCSLYDLLYNPAQYVPKLNLTTALRLRILADTVLALEYIHSLSIVHRDIKSHNVLITAELRPKITDFGLSKSKDVSSLTTNSNYSEGGGGGEAFKGTPAYLAPEIYRESSYTKYSDIYAFSVLMNEVLTRQQPFANMSPLDIMICVAKNDSTSPLSPGNYSTSRPALFSAGDFVSGDGSPADDYLVSELQVLISKGWSDNPTSRPQFNLIGKALNRLKGNDADINSSYHNHQHNQQMNGSASFHSLKEGDNSPKKHSASRHAEATTGKQAVQKELVDWLVNVVELFPDTSHSYAELLVKSGVTSLAKLSKRVRAMPSFLVTIGIGEFEAADISTALEKVGAEGGNTPSSPTREPRSSSSATIMSSSTNNVAELVKSGNPQLERNLMLRARDSKTVPGIITVLSEIIQIEPLTSLSTETLRECFTSVINLCGSSMVNQVELGKSGACVLIVTLLHAYYSTTINHGNAGLFASNVDSSVLEQGLWCVSILANNNTANQTVLGEADCCPLIVGILKSHADKFPSVAEKGLCAIENVALEATNRETLGSKGVCTLLVSMLSHYSKSGHNAIVEHCLAAITNLCRSSPANQTKFGQANVCAELVSVLSTLSLAVMSIADYALYTVRSVALNHPANIELFVSTDIVNILLQALSVHGSISATVAESGLAALAVLCGHGAHAHSFYYSPYGYALLVNMLQMYGPQSKAVASQGLVVYNALLAFMISGGNQQQSPQAIMMQSPVYSSPNALHDMAVLIVNILKGHGSKHPAVAEQSMIALTHLTVVATSVNFNIYALYADLQVHALIPELLHAFKNSHSVVSLSFELLLVLCRYPENVTKLTVGNNGQFYKFIIELVATHSAPSTVNDKNKTSGANSNPFKLADTGFRLYSVLFCRLPAVETNNGDVSTCRYLIPLLNDTYNAVLSSNHDINTSGKQITAASRAVAAATYDFLQTVMITVKYISAYNPNKKALGDLGGCKLFTDITRSFASTDMIFAENSLEIIANMAALNDNDPRLAKEGCCKLIIDLLIQYAYSSPLVTEHGLRAVSNLAVANKGMLGELNACAIVVDLIRFYLTTNNQHNETIACQASVTIYNLAIKDNANKTRFNQLEAPKELQIMLTNRQLSEAARKEVKDAITAIRF